MRAESDLELIHTHHSAAEREVQERSLLSKGHPVHMTLNHSVLPVNRTVSPCIPYTYYLTVNSSLFLLLPFPLLVEMPVSATLTLLGQHCSREKLCLPGAAGRCCHEWFQSTLLPSLPSLLSLFIFERLEYHRIKRLQLCWGKETSHASAIYGQFPINKR